MKKNHAWSALIITIFVTMILIIIAIYLLEKIVPFSRDIKWVENGNISYYRANTALNSALLSMSGSDPSIENTINTLTNGSGMIYRITASGTTLPQTGQGNSEYDKNWSILAPGKPVQLLLSNNAALTQKFSFRVPDLKWDGSFSQTLSGTAMLPIINWALSASGDTLQASGSYSTTGVFLWGSYIMATLATSGTVIFDNSKVWLTLSGSSTDFSSFYTSNCTTTLPKCTLKLSLINPLILTTGETAPYLEYQAIFSTAVPLQTAVIQTEGYAGGFRKNITRYIQQMTTNEALDFTVFQ